MSGLRIGRESGTKVAKDEVLSQNIDRRSMFRLPVFRDRTIWIEALFSRLLGRSLTLFAGMTPSTAKAGFASTAFFAGHRVKSVGLCY